MFSIQHINKKHECFFFIIVIIKNMQLISYQSKTGLVMERPERCMTGVAYRFNLTLLQKYDLTWKILLYLTCSFMSNVYC